MELSREQWGASIPNSGQLVDSSNVGSVEVHVMAGEKRGKEDASRKSVRIAEESRRVIGPDALSMNDRDEMGRSRDDADRVDRSHRRISWKTKLLEVRRTASRKLFGDAGGGLQYQLSVQIVMDGLRQSGVGEELTARFWSRDSWEHPIVQGGDPASTVAVPEEVEQLRLKGAGGCAPNEVPWHRRDWSWYQRGE